MELYKKHELYVIKKALNTYFLGKDKENIYDSYIVKGIDSKVLAGFEVGDLVECYFYIGKDKKEHITLQKPIIEMGEIGLLKCQGIGKVGAFFDLGYEKDVMMPFIEKVTDFHEGDKVLVKLYLDKTGRPCVTQKIKKHLEEVEKYQLGAEVDGTIYMIDDEQGVFVALEDKYFGLILTNEMMPNMKVGDKLRVRVTKVREDGRYNVTASKRIHVQMDEDSEKLLKFIEENGGFLAFDDKTDSEVIKQNFSMSKRAFKRAIGRLLKNKKITLEAEGGIRLNK